MADVERMWGHLEAAPTPAPTALETPAVSPCESAGDSECETPAKPKRYRLNDPGELSRGAITRLIRHDSYRRRAAAARADFFCNRLIEDRFPPVEFSDMEPIPCCFYDMGHRIEKEN